MHITAQIYLDVHRWPVVATDDPCFYTMMICCDTKQLVIQYQVWNE